jgi:hypothetical protein
MVTAEEVVSLDSRLYCGPDQMGIQHRPDPEFSECRIESRLHANPCAIVNAAEFCGDNVGVQFQTPEIQFPSRQKLAAKFKIKSLSLFILKCAPRPLCIPAHRVKH